jgi:hypothetical protein
MSIQDELAFVRDLLQVFFFIILLCVAVCGVRFQSAKSEKKDADAEIKAPSRKKTRWSATAADAKVSC